MTPFHSKSKLIGGILLILLLCLGAGLNAQLPWYTLAIPTNLHAEGVECAAYLTWDKPQIPVDIQVTESFPRASYPFPSAEYSPTCINRGGYGYSDGIWDILFSWSAVDGQRPGIEQDNNFVYLSAWQSGSGAPPWFQKYEKMTGILVGGFDIPGATAIRDMASDGQYFYGSPASSTIYQMNFTNHSLVGSWNTGITSGIRHLSYDPHLNNGNGGFWGGNWSDMKAIRFDGTLLWSGPAMTNCYGSTFDNNTSGGPFLWTFTQTGVNQAELTQYAIGYTPLNLTPTGVVFDVGTVPGFLPGATAGGLCSGPVGTKYALIADVQQEPQFIVGFEQAAYGIQYTTPPGLIGYRIYRDGVYQTYVSGQDTTWYYDFTVVPGYHEYSVSAYYDLMEYDYPGYYDESALSTPEEISIVCSTPQLPNCETWDQASFAYNEWHFSPEQGNWSITTGDGDPAPSATFLGTPAATGYSYALISRVQNTSPWNCAVLHFDFDLRLSDVNTTGNEKLAAELYYWDAWHLVDLFSNTGSFGWEHFHYELPDACGSGIRIRFRVFGENSSDMESWSVDNICLAAYCNSPTSPDGTFNGDEVHLTWHPPVCYQQEPVTWIQEEIFYHNEIPAISSFSYFDHVYGSVFDLSGYPNALLYELDFHHDAYGFPCNWKYRVHVVDWSTRQEIGTIGPFFTSADGGWVENISLDSLTGWDGSKIGIFIQPMGNVPDNAWPRISSDNSGPQQTSLYGSFPHYQSLDTLTTGNYLINLRILVPDTSDENHLSTGSPETDIPGLIGYMVYRSIDNMSTFSLLTQSAIPDTTYTDPDPPLSLPAVHYYVTALFNDIYYNIFLCESLPSDTVSVLITSIPDPEPSSLQVYPNPATEKVYVTSDQMIERIVLSDNLGRSVMDIDRINSRTIVVGLDGLDPGIYIMRVYTLKGISVKKIIIRE